MKSFDQYHYYLKALTVCKWKKNKGYEPLAKWGEAICQDELVNFFENEEHKYCECSWI